jgi:hypothetical protein
MRFKLSIIVDMKSKKDFGKLHHQIMELIVPHGGETRMQIFCEVCKDLPYDKGLHECKGCGRLI